MKLRLPALPSYVDQHFEKFRSTVGQLGIERPTVHKTLRRLERRCHRVGRDRTKDSMRGHDLGYKEYCSNRCKLVDR